MTSPTPDVSPDEVTARLSRLADDLVARGSVRTDRWRRAVLGVARHVFVPGYWVDERLGTPPARWRWVDGADPGQRDEWLDAVYSDDTLVTDLRTQPQRGQAPAQRVVTCSSTLPGLVVHMIEDLDPQPGEQVLEIGTGTGYSTALLCHGLGDVHVTSVDIDPDLVDAARRRLAVHGYHPTLATSDGERGLPGRAPFDRIIATCSVDAIPSAWIAQTRPGGAILANLRGSLMRGAQVRLTAYGDGTAMGMFLPGYGSFMALRRDPAAPYDHRVVVDKDLGPVTRGTSGLDPATLSTDKAWAFVAQLHLPDLVVSSAGDADAPATEVATADRSWARVTAAGDAPDAGFVVVQAGPRRLWDVLERAHHTWVDSGRPRWDRYGLTVTPDHAQVWLDEPGNLMSTV